MVVLVNKSKCVSCGGCVGVCPVAALTLKSYPVCDEKCNNCKICINFCPVGALSLK